MKGRINPEELVGLIFGKLTVIKYDGYYDLSGRGRKKHWYVCNCSCGNRYLARRDHLLEGRVVSCGNCHRILQECDYFRYITSNGESFIFDKEDYEIATSYTWCISGNKEGKQYVVARGPEGKIILFSRMILGAGDNEVVDHINGDTLNNRRLNLRKSDIAQNSRNTKLRSDNSSGYKGVGYLPESGRYRAYIGYKGKTIYLGHYDNAEEAARAYDTAARLYFGEYACLNFPLQGEQGCNRNPPGQEKNIA